MQGPLRAMVQEDLNKMGIHGTAPHKRRSKTHVNSVSNNQVQSTLSRYCLRDRYHIM